jgi:hypothetical protein
MHLRVSKQNYNHLQYFHAHIWAASKIIGSVSDLYRMGHTVYIIIHSSDLLEVSIKIHTICTTVKITKPQTKSFMDNQLLL